MLRPVLHAPDPRLHEVALPVLQYDAALRTLVADLADTMYAEGGIGLAATQVGVPQRVVVIDLQPNAERRTGLRVFVNPVLSKGKGRHRMKEGCLSVPQVTVEPERFARIEVQALDEHGRAFRLKADGLLAACLQHEVDHLDGILMTDRLNRPLQA
jgi:peptide deformylase